MFLWKDVDECLEPNVCTNGDCSNLEGSYMCSCHKGYTRTPDQKHCKVPRSSYKSYCWSSVRELTSQSFASDFFHATKQVYELSERHYIDECQQGNLCINGQCKNTEGSFRCTCRQGYQLSAAKDQCEDIDECQHRHLCAHGQCRNTEGSFQCVCDQGYRASGLGDHCEGSEFLKEGLNPTFERSG
ncbi:hypothetical protein P7K49_028851 [Saguinus oedipus]|uniref:EGF-like domain-containing protein n=1 Tax=Saguinus oedipus TaxID=9490 RepID=A0ABQ9U5I4_SAGOE|nr:hypothetical protein P7K49_028851 [Saguinus oedipus]